MNIVERLKDSLDYEYNLSFSERKQLLEEIDRLNNIINELEEYIKKNTWYYPTSGGCQWVDQFKVLDKLKALKENNNEF